MTSNNPDDETDASSMKRPLTVSLIAHGLIILLLIVGLPHINTRDFVEPQPIVVELAELADIAQTDKPKPKPVKAKPEEMPPPPKQEDLPEPAKESKPEPKPEPAPEPEPKKEEVKPEPKKEEPKPEQPVKEEPKKEEPKPEPVKEEPKKEEPKKEEDASDFDSILKNLANVEETSDADIEETKEETKQTSSSDAPLGDKVTMTELDLLRQQLSRCWNLPAGAQDAQDLRIEVRIQVNPDRTVRGTEIVDQGRYARDGFFRAAADSARRAVVNPNCSPLELPPEKYEQWKNILIVFDPREMF
tara:strand:+ start:287939 stop:288844 length:906 start_codon:yes stop_codon:yes gene_type:complete